MMGSPTRTGILRLCGRHGGRACRSCVPSPAPSRHRPHNVRTAVASRGANRPSAECTAHTGLSERTASPLIAAATHGRAVHGRTMHTCMPRSSASHGTMSGARPTSACSAACTAARSNSAVLSETRSAFSAAGSSTHSANVEYSIGGSGASTSSMTSPVLAEQVLVAHVTNSLLCCGEPQRAGHITPCRRAVESFRKRV